jgi:hypothetical protein
MLNFLNDRSKINIMRNNYEYMKKIMRCVTTRYLSPLVPLPRSNTARPILMNELSFEFILTTPRANIIFEEFFAAQVDRVNDNNGSKGRIYYNMHSTTVQVVRFVGSILLVVIIDSYLL